MCYSSEQISKFADAGETDDVSQRWKSCHGCTCPNLKIFSWDSSKIQNPSFEIVEADIDLFGLESVGAFTEE